MYIAGGSVVAVYLLLFILSFKEHLPEEMYTGNIVLRPFYKIGEYILRIRGKKSTRSRTEHDLEKLNPGCCGEDMYREYQITKIGQVLAIILAVTVFTLLVAWQEGRRGYLSEGRIERGDYTFDPITVELEAEIEGYASRVMELTVNGRIPERGIADELEERFWEELKDVALGENESWEKVQMKLDLREELNGYPFCVKWTSDDPALVDDMGNVRISEDSGNVSTLLNAVVMYEDWEWDHTLALTVCPVTLPEEEMAYRELMQFLEETESTGREEESLVLPGEWRGREVIWYEHSENQALFLWMLGLAGGIAVFFFKDRDLHAKLEEREKELRAAYPLVVNKLVLYLGAGLTVNGAFVRAAQDYMAELKRGGKKHPAWEEILYTCREVETGISEAQAYERYGKRCGSVEYIRLGALLTQNLKKGNSELLIRLREEADAALTEQVNYSRQIGEEASTKLLVPMVMMLGIVMVIIMIPAFGSM